MEIIYFLLPISLFLALLGLGAFIWCVKERQYDDIDSPAIRMVFEDEPLGAPQLLGAQDLSQTDESSMMEDFSCPNGEGDEAQ